MINCELEIVVIGTCLKNSSSLKIASKETLHVINTSYFHKIYFMCYITTNGIYLIVCR